jgi:hypothetical protein
MQVRIIEELVLLNGSTFFSLITQLGTDDHDAGGPGGCQLTWQLSIKVSIAPLLI